MANESTARSKSRAKPVMVRIPNDWLEILEAAQYLRRHDSMQALVLDALRHFLTVVKDEPEIALALKARADRDARLAGLLVDISSKTAEHRPRRRSHVS